MFGIDTRKWFSFFRKGVELLADMSTKWQFNEQQVRGSEPRGFVLQKQIPHSRAIAIKKAQAASRSGRAKPRQGAFKWAGVPSSTGHGVPNSTGHGAPSFEKSMSQFGQSLAKFFYPHRCSATLAGQAIVASTWLKQTESWQGMPWYGPIMGHFSLFREPDFARQQTHLQHKGQQQPRSMPTRAFLRETAAKTTMVAAQRKKSPSNGVNTGWCAGFLPIAQQAFFGTLQKISGRDHISM